MPYVPHPLLDFDPGVGQRAEGVQFRLRDRSGAVIGKLTPVADTASITLDSASKVARTLSGLEVTRLDYDAVNPFADTLAPVWVLEDGSEWPLGVYYFTGDPKNERTVKLTPLSDGTGLLDEDSTRAWGVPRGGSLTAMMEELCSAAGIRARQITGAGAYAGEPIAWPIGTSYLEILTRLCGLAGFFPPHFTVDGVLRLIPATPIRASAVTFPGDNLTLAGSGEENGNLLTAPNVHLVVSSGAKGEEIVGQAEVDPSLPWSVAKRGRRKVIVHRMQGIESTDQARMMAERFAAVHAADYAERSYSTPPDPRYDHFDTVSARGTIYRSVGYSLPLKPGGEMTHRVNRAGEVNPGAN